MKHQFVPIERVLSKLLKNHGLEEEYYFNYLSSNWESVIGPTLAKISKPKALRENKLLLEIATESWKNEFIKRREKTRKMINQKIEGYEIKEIEIL